MLSEHIALIAQELNVQEHQVTAVAALLEAEATIPFIARYRKEATGSLNEVAIASIRDRLEQLKQLDDRRTSILKSLEQNGHLNEELKTAVMGAAVLSVLEDLYLPYRPKRRTRAMLAREKGLEPLAVMIFQQNGYDPETAALEHTGTETTAASIEEALCGARDIIAEHISEDPRARASLRDLFNRKANLTSRVIAGREAAGANYRDYFDWQEPASAVPSHRLLAMRRGEAEDVLDLSLQPPETDAIALLEGFFVKGTGDDSRQVRLALQDSYRRLLSRSMETELRVALKERAEQEAIRVFADNLRELLLASPLGPRRVMAIDPGFRTGCKMACLDPQGRLLHYDTLFPHGSERQTEEAGRIMQDLVARFQTEVIAVGNGTAGRETEQFLRRLVFQQPVSVVLVDESGASVYSASETAREEFPSLDLTVRGAVSIGRRLMDPLAELVKIDPKSIGVGQYQHDVDPGKLKQALDDVVISCVNCVGVDLNQASRELLTYVSGLGPQLAKQIVAFRDSQGPFRSRHQLREIPRLGPKTFEQCAGFLRIRDGENPLDASAVHPESYAVVEAMATDLSCLVGDLISSPVQRSAIDLARYLSPTVGMPTLHDILQELAKPGRDPRREFEFFAFAPNVREIKDLIAGMRLPGIVTNVTAFGAFVDIGVHQDGLVHVSELSTRFVKNPLDVVKVHQKVQVTILAVDPERNRIALSMKTARAPDEPSQRPKKTARIPSQPSPARTRPSPQPFNNPFADLLKKR